MFSLNNRPFSCMTLILLIFALVSACGTAGKSSRGNSSIPQMNIIKPCAKQFYPQVALKQTVSSLEGHSLYFLSGVHLYALNASNGALKWCLLISNAESHESLEASLLSSFMQKMPPPPNGLGGLEIQNNRIFVTAANAFTYAFDAASGKQIWQHYTSYSSGIPIIASNTLYVSSDSIYALSTQDGTEHWSYPMPDVISMAPMIVNDTIYAGSYGNAVYALNATSGKARWIYHTDGRVYVAPTVYQSTVYVGIGDNGPRLFAIDAQSGKLRWHTDTFISSETQLTIADGLLYTSQGGMLVGLDPQNGKVMWRYNDIQWASLLNDGHILYVESNTGDLYAFNTQMHNMLWHTQVRTLKAGQTARMKIIGNELYAGFNELGSGDQFASIHALNIHTGKEDWSARVNWNISTLDISA